VIGGRLTDDNYATIITAMEGTLSDEQVVQLTTLMGRHLGLQATVVDSRLAEPGTDPNGDVPPPAPEDTTEGADTYGGDLGGGDSDGLGGSTTISPHDLYDISAEKVLTAQARIRKKIELIDDMIEELLAQAAAMGCFDMELIPNPCDWSPKFFYKSMYKLLSLAKRVRNTSCDSALPASASRSITPRLARKLLISGLSNTAIRSLARSGSLSSSPVACQSHSVCLGICPRSP